jgi:hypothetical protein
MATDKRTSEQGTAFDRAIVRDFLLTALEHDAVTDRVNKLLLDHSRRSEEYTVDAEDFKRVLTEVLSAAWYIDWEWVAQTLKATRDDDAASTDQSSDTTIRLPDVKDMIEVEVDLRNLFVRPLASEEAYSLELIMQDHQADAPPVTRIQAAILLGSNAGCTTSQIAAMLVVDEAKVRKVITDANERGAEVLAARQAEREHVIKTARDLDLEGFDADTCAARPGKYAGAGDLQLVVALDIINGHGFADENLGDAAVSGYAWRVDRFVGIEDSQGFVRAEEWPSARQAEERLRDFDAPDHGDSADEQEA